MAFERQKTLGGVLQEVRGYSPTKCICLLLNKTVIKFRVCIHKHVNVTNVQKKENITHEEDSWRLFGLKFIHMHNNARNKN
jgi:hypothetical protein